MHLNLSKKIRYVSVSFAVLLQLTTGLMEVQASTVDFSLEGLWKLESEAEKAEVQKNDIPLVMSGAVSDSTYQSIRISDIQVSGLDVLISLTTTTEEGDEESVPLSNDLQAMSIGSTQTPIEVQYHLMSFSQPLSWKSSDAAVAYVKDNMLYIIGSGTAAIQAYYGSTTIQFQVDVEQHQYEALRRYINGFYQTLLDEVPLENYLFIWANRSVMHQWTENELKLELIQSEEIQKTASTDENYINMLMKASGQVKSEESVEMEKKQLLQSMRYENRADIWTSYTKEHPIDIQEMDIVEQSADPTENSDAATTDIQSVTPSASGFAWPLTVPGTVTSPFGTRICPYHGPEHHNGVDISSPTGTPVLATAAGTVVISEPNPSCGNYIVIDHGNGYRSTYMHNSELYVSAGQTVVQGQTIAAVGMTGNATGPHLDFRLQLNGAYVNPLDYVSP